MTVRPLSQTNVPIAERLAGVLAQLDRIVVGKREPLRLAFACLLARGHLLIEDIPGVGKSTLAQALATTLGLKYARVQFTSDLLPADVLGVSIFDTETRAFRFHPGPIFHSVVLADEINRAPPKTQSALMEAMEERQVSQDGETRKLPDPFFVIATQNPVEQIGAYPLPESQLDRFLMAIEIGYPDPAAERELLMSGDRRAQMATLAAARRSADAAGMAEAKRPPCTCRRRCSTTCRRCSRPRAATSAAAPMPAHGADSRRARDCCCSLPRAPGRSSPDARWCCRRTCRRCSPRSPGIGWPAARAPAPCRRRRCCAPSRCPERLLRPTA